MKKIILVGVIVIVLFAITILILKNTSQNNFAEKIYVAVEGDGKVAVIDPIKQQVINTIDLSLPHEGGRLAYLPHNVQVAPNYQTVWVTVNTGKHEEHSYHIIPRISANGDDHEGESDEPDEVIVINPNTDTVARRIKIKSGLNLAHVVLTPDSRWALVTAQNTSSIYKIDALSFSVSETIPAVAGSEPHGLRVSPDGKTAYIAMLQGKSLGILDIAANSLSLVPLDGAAVQTGVTPDGKYAVASLYDTKVLAVFNTVTKVVTKIALPANAKGPIQMYSTPDSRFIYLTDQGYYFDQPVGNNIYKIDLQERSIAREIKAGKAPHGVVVSPDGKFVYVTNLLSDDISIIDTTTDQEVAKIPVGKLPNGISYWSTKP